MQWSISRERGGGGLPLPREQTAWVVSYEKIGGTGGRQKKKLRWKKKKVLHG